MRKSVVKAFKKVLPPLSQTQKEALEAGTVGWEGELMSGHPDWKKLFELKKPEFTAEEQAFLDGPVEKLCEVLKTWDIQANDDLPKEAWDIIKKEGFMGLEVPVEYGGKGFSSQLHSAVVMKLSSRNVTGAVTVMVPNSLGPAKLIYHYGTQEQKDKYLKPLASGEEIPCFALTEPNAGSDAEGIEARGTVIKNPDGTLGIKLNWEKRYITLAPIATLIGLACKLEDPDNLLGTGEKHLGITSVLIPRDTAGVDIGERHKPMDLPFMNGPIRGKDVIIPIDNVIGGQDGIGKGWKMLVECLSVGRALSLPAQSVAAAKLAAYATGSYTRVRKQFDVSIGKFEGIEEVLGRMAGSTYMMDSARLMTLQMVDQGGKPAVPSAIVKYHLTEQMRKNVNDSMDILGGKGVMNGPSNFISDAYKGIPVAITVEGANIMTRNLIIFGQGIFLAHPYVMKEIRATEEQDDKKAFNTLVATVLKHAGNTLRSKLASFTHGITHGAGSSVPKGVDKSTKKYYREINRLSAVFNLVSDTSLLTIGAGLKSKERVSARLGDVLSNLYMASATLWNFEQNGKMKEELPLVHWACTKALYEAEQAMDDLLRNYPNKFVAGALRILAFPTGRHFKKPSDKMDKAAADVIRNPGAARDRLTANIFKPADESEPLHKLETAFRACIEAEALEKKVSVAVKKGELPSDLKRLDLFKAAWDANVIGEGEYAQLVHTEKLRRDVIMVDSFAPVKKAQDSAPKAG